MAPNEYVKAVIESTGFDLDVAEDRQALGQLVGCDPADAAFLQRLQKVIEIAVNEWLSWAIASRRFNTLSELDTDRVLRLFLEVRHAAPTVEALVEQLAMPQGRATSMISRMKYGQARQLLRLSFESALHEVQTRLKSTKEDNGAKQITVTRETLDRLRDAEFDIFSALDGSFPKPQLLTVQSTGRLGAVVRTSPKMWGYLVANLTSRSQS